MEPTANVPIEHKAPPLTADRVPTGWVSLDVALRGGIPCGTVSIIAGRPDVGKTTLACHIAANAVKAGFKVLYIDVEGRIVSNIERITDRGITEADMGTRFHLAVGVPTIEQAAAKVRGEILSALSANEAPPRVVIVDSIASLITRKQLEARQAGDERIAIGEWARAFQEAFKDICTSYVPQHQIAMVWTTQVRTVIAPHGSYERPYMSNWIWHIASVLIHLKEEKEEDNDLDVDDMRFKGFLVSPFKHIVFRLEKNQTGYGSKLEGRGRYFLMAPAGFARGDFDPLYEILIWGNTRESWGFLRKDRAEENPLAAERGRKTITFQIKGSDLTFQYPAIYRDRALYDAVVAECLPKLTSVLTAFYTGRIF